jgi:hypothetical protein
MRTMYVYARLRKFSLLYHDVLHFIPSRSNTLLQDRAHKGFVGYKYASYGCPAKLEIPDQLGSPFRARLTEQPIVRLLGQRGAEILSGRTIRFAPVKPSQGGTRSGATSIGILRHHYVVRLFVCHGARHRLRHFALRDVAPSTLRVSVPLHNPRIISRPQHDAFLCASFRIALSRPARGVAGRARF